MQCTMEPLKINTNAKNKTFLGQWVEQCIQFVSLIQLCIQDGWFKPRIQPNIIMTFISKMPVLGLLAVSAVQRHQCFYGVRFGEQQQTITCQIMVILAKKSQTIQLRSAPCFYGPDHNNLHASTFKINNWL